MSKYQVGDKVRVIDVKYGAPTETLGYEGKILTVEDEGVFGISYALMSASNGPWWYGPDEIADAALPLHVRTLNRVTSEIHASLDELGTVIHLLKGERVRVTLPATWRGRGAGMTFTGTVTGVYRKPSDVTGKSLGVTLDREERGSDLPFRFTGISPLDVVVL